MFYGSQHWAAGRLRDGAVEVGSGEVARSWAHVVPILGAFAAARSARRAAGRWWGSTRPRPWQSAVGMLIVLAPALGFGALLGQASKIASVGVVGRASVEAVGFVVVILAWLFLAGTGMVRDRTAAFHGAEHQAFNALRSGVPLESQRVGRMSVRATACSTSFVTLVLAALAAAHVMGSRWFALGAGFWGAATGRAGLLVGLFGLTFLLQVFIDRAPTAIAWPIRAPGMALQRWVTDNPSQLEVEMAIAVLRELLSKDAGLPDPEDRAAPRGLEPGCLAKD